MNQLRRAINYISDKHTGMSRRRVPVKISKGATFADIRNEKGLGKLAWHSGSQVWGVKLNQKSRESGRSL